MDQEIVDYILQAQRHGLQDLEIKQNLLNAGWDANAVEQSFIFAKAADTHTTPGLISPTSGMKQEMPVQPLQAAQQPVKVQLTPSVMPAQTQPAMVQPTVGLSDQHFQTTSKKSFFKRPAFWIVLVVLFVLAGGAYGYYSLVLANPTKVWQKFSQASPDKIYETNFNFSYSDPGSYDGSDLGFQLKDIKLSLTGGGYLNYSDPQNPESSSTLQYTFSSGNTSFSTGLQYMLQNKNLYLNVGQNPILDMVSQEANNGQKIDWIKIDLAALAKEATSTSDAQGAKFLQDIATPDFKAQLEKIWADATIVKEDKLLGKEKINGVYTLHFQNSIDKQAIKNLANQYVDTLSKKANDDGAAIADTDIQTIKEVFSQIIDKIQITSFETWVGMTDFKLYKIHFVTNAPSVISLAKNAGSLNLSGTSGSANDSKRIADVRQMASALELYYNDNSGYPDGKNGQPVGISPNYIGVFPTAPAADGSCTDFYNTYYYQPEGKARIVNGKTVYDSYQMTFCFGGSVGGYKAGIGMLTPSGIQDNIPCPGSPDHCIRTGAPATSSSDPNAAMKQEVTDFINKLDFSAQISIDANYNNYGKKETVTPPASSFDLMQKIMEAEGQSTNSAGDAKRIADVRQLASANELYFNDKNMYPAALKDLVPDYIGVLPTAPTPPGGDCSATENNYSYTKVSNTSYKLTFCLGFVTGGYQPGPHTLTEAGIQ